MRAEINYRKALELIGESLSGDDHFIVRFYLGVGKFKRAYELLQRMRRNDPINQAFLAWYYYTYGLLGERQRAEEITYNYCRYIKYCYHDSPLVLKIKRSGVPVNSWASRILFSRKRR